MKMPDRKSRGMMLAFTIGPAASELGTSAVIASPSAENGAPRPPA